MGIILMKIVTLWFDKSNFYLSNLYLKIVIKKLFFTKWKVDIFMITNKILRWIVPGVKDRDPSRNTQFWYDPDCSPKSQ